MYVVLILFMLKAFPVLSNSFTIFTISMSARTDERLSSYWTLHKVSCALRCIVTQHFRWCLVSLAVASPAFGVLFRRKKNSDESNFFATSSNFLQVSLTKTILSFLPGTWKIMHFVLSYNVNFNRNDLSSLFGMFPFF